jgi:hypothetical protein
MLYYAGRAIESCFFLGKDIRKNINSVSFCTNSILKIERLTVSLLGKHIETLQGDFLKQFMKDYLEEVIHVKHHDIRNWILNTEDPKHVKKWIITLRVLMENLIKDPTSLAEDYLGFIFKKEKILELIENSNINNTIKSILDRPWNGEERPVHRPYPTVELKDDISDEEAIKLFIPLSRFLHRIGFIT